MSRAGALQIAMTTAALLLGGAMAQAQQVGTASAVNPAATANMKTITIGQSIAHKERIQTKSSGSVQLLFLDKTSMTIGPNSDLTIDEYVYDPNANTGKLAATLGKGALRFVGGQISHNGDAEIKTASALIGIRGGVMMTDGKGGIYSGYGAMTVNSGGQTVTLHAGEFTQTRAGNPPTMPDLPPPGFVQQLILAFQSAAGQTGGARRGAASPANIASAEEKATGSSGGSVTGSGAPPSPTPPTIVGQINAIASAVAQSIQTSNQAAGVQQIARRPSVTLKGYLGGFDIITNYRTVNTSPLAGSAEITLDAPNNRVQANLNTLWYDPNNPFSQLTGTIRALFRFDSSGSYGDYNNFEAAVPSNSFVNGIPTTGSMVNVNNDALRQLAGNTSLAPCQCDYTRWGFWKVQNNTSNTVFSENIIGTWVAGRPVGSISDVPITGSAIYTGHVAATVLNNGTPYFAAGNFSNAVDFGTRTGAVSVTNLDNTNYSGTVNFNTNDPRNFGGTLAGSTGARSMALQGSFFQGKTSPVGEMGGSVAISGANNYLGSGIFAAAKH